RVNGAVDLPEGARSDAHKRGLPERWMIEYVEEVTAQVQRVTLMEFEVLGQGHVPVLLTWPPESIAGHVAKAGRRVAQSEVRYVRASGIRYRNCRTEARRIQISQSPSDLALDAASRIGVGNGAVE